MSYRIIYHHFVYEEDLPAINKDIQQRIRNAIESRLAVAPEQYGKPLRKTLKRFWKLRVGDYRLVYIIIKDEVQILAIAHRNKVYQLAFKRIYSLYPRG